MRKIHVMACAAFFALVSLSGAAMAAPAFLPHTVTMRAGPGGGFPPVARIPAGAGVDVHGCTEGWRWCDVNAGGLRGWVYGPSLAPSAYAPYQPISAFGPALGLSFVFFNQDDYWGRYYRDRPFYANWRQRSFGRNDFSRPARFRANAAIRNETVSSTAGIQVQSVRQERGQRFMTTRATRMQSIQPSAGVKVRTAAPKPMAAPRNVSSQGGRRGEQAPRHGGGDHRNRQ